MKNRKLSAYVNEETYKEFVKMAESQERSVSWLLEKLIKEYLKNEK